jgi:membrane protein
MKVKINKGKIIEACILIGFILYKYILMWLRVPNIYTNLIIIGLVSISFLILMQKKFSRIEIIKVIILFLFGCVTYYNSTMIDIFVATIFAMLYARDKEGIKDFIKIFTYTSIILYVITIILFLLGFLGNVASQRYVNEYLVERNSLGFMHVNSPFLHFVPIALGLIYINREKSAVYKFITIIVVDIISIVIYNYTLSRTGAIIIIILNMIMIFQKYILDNKVTKYIFKYAFITLGIFLTFYIAYKFGNDFTDKSLNRVLSFRPMLALDAIKTYPVKPFGNAFGERLILDSLYLRVLLGAGYISYIFYTYFQIKTFKYIEKDKYLYLILIVFSIYQLFENVVTYNMNFLLTIQFMLYLKYNDEKN